MRESSATKRVLVTGATGFVGSHLLRRLRALYPDDEVVALRRPDSRMDLVPDLVESVEWIQGDILDGHLLREAMQGIDQVYHAAGMVSFDPRRAVECMRVNVRGAEEVVNAALYSGISKLVHISSIMAIGYPRHLKVLDESFVWERGRRNSQYGISKFLAEQEVWRGMAEGLEAVILNPSLILGCGRWHEGTNRFFRWVARGLLAAPPGSTGFVDVRDVVGMAIGVMSSDLAGQRFVVNGGNLEFRDLLTQIARSLGVQPPKFVAGRLVRSLAWRASWIKGRLQGKEPLLTKESARISGYRYAYDGSAIATALQTNYRPLQETVNAIATRYSREGSAFFKNDDFEKGNGGKEHISRE